MTLGRDVLSPRSYPAAYAPAETTGILEQHHICWCFVCVRLVETVGGFGKSWRCPRCRTTAGSRTPEKHRSHDL